MPQRILLTLLTISVAGAWARSPEREILPLSITWDVGIGTNVHVLGNHPDAGSWIPTNAIKLRWTSGNVWTGRLAMQKGTALEYKFVSRNGSTNLYCDPANIVWEPGGNRTSILAAAPTAPYSGKTMFYYSGWTNVDLIYFDGMNFTSRPMERTGPGRAAGEYAYRLTGFAEEGEGVEFIPSGYLVGGPFYDHAPYPGYGNSNYHTALDVFLLQDGNIFNYWPSSSVSAPRLVTNFVNSTSLGITGRVSRIYLPRGYDNHSWKRYPVLYLQDGTNVFDPGGTYGTWSADATATREIGQGRMRECILVGVDNSPLRQSEYMPPGDQYPGQPAGTADAYLRYLLDNVRPTLDFNFRTLNDPRNTLVGGSSMGGLFSIYAGYETNVFGGVLAMSPAITRAPNYTAALWLKAKQPIRIYLDTGSVEGNVGPGTGNYWEKPWETYDIFIAHGYAPNSDLLMRIGCGQGHNEAAWKARLPEALRFLLNVRDEPNHLAGCHQPHTFRRP
jgi:predicted alpha/beta superfamily hydrolase